MRVGTELGIDEPPAQDKSDLWIGNRHYQCQRIFPLLRSLKFAQQGCAIYGGFCSNMVIKKTNEVPTLVQSVDL